VVALGKAIARASSGLRKPDRYELRMDFEHDLYSVAHADKDSLDLDFLRGKFLAEQDPDAGAKSLTDLVTLTRTTTATYRDANGVLQEAAADTPRRHYPAPRIVGMLYTDDFTGYADQAAAVAAGWHSFGSEATFDPAGDAWDIDGTQALQSRLDFDVQGLPGNTPGRFGVRVTGLSGGAVHVQVGNSGATAGAAITSDGVALTLPTQIAADGTLEISVRFAPGAACSVTEVFFQEFSHFDGENAGLLLEPGAQNDITDTLDDSLPDYNAFGVTPTASSETWVDGVTTSSKLVESAATEAHYVVEASFAQSPAGGVSAFIKAAERHMAVVAARWGNQSASTLIDLRTGEHTALVVNGSFGGELDVEYWGDGWYRVCIRYTSGGYPTLLVGPTTYETHQGGNFNPGIAWDYAGDGSSGIYFLAGQHERGTSAVTSLIVAGASATARAQDVPSIPLGLATIRPEGDFTLRVDWTYNTQPLMYLRNTGTGERMSTSYTGVGPRLRFLGWGRNQTVYTDNAYPIAEGDRNAVVVTRLGRDGVISQSGQSNNSSIETDVEFADAADEITFKVQTGPLLVHALSLSPSGLSQADADLESAL